MSVGADRGWAGEFLDRHNKVIIVLTKNEEIRGQVEVHTQAEKDRWELVLEFLNEVPALPKRE